MRFTSAAVIAAAVSMVSAQGYNSTSSMKPSNHSAPVDSRTVNVPAPSTTPPAFITSVGTIYSTCGSVTVLLPSYHISSNSNVTMSRSSTFTGSATSTPSGGAANKIGAAIAGVGAVVAGALVL